MDEKTNSTPPPPNDGDRFVAKLLWLCAAFIPSVIGVACLQLKNPGQGLLPALLILNLVFCVTASIGLLQGMKSEASRFIFAVFLILCFFVLNTLIVLFIGCSGMGRIAP